MPEPTRAALPALRITYPKQMKLHQVYTVQIDWYNIERTYPGKGVALRLFVGGAQVVPDEQLLGAGNPEARTGFAITPIAKGNLKYCRLEVVAQDRKVQEFALPMKVTTKRWPWILLALALVVPWALLSWCSPSPLENERTTAAEGMHALIQSYLPTLPAFVTDNLPNAPQWLNQASEWIGQGYGKLCEWCGEYPIPLYVGLFFFAWSLLASMRRREKTAKLVGDPVPWPMEERSAPAASAVATQRPVAKKAGGSPFQF